MIRSLQRQDDKPADQEQKTVKFRKHHRTAGNRVSTEFGKFKTIVMRPLVIAPLILTLAAAGYVKKTNTFAEFIDRNGVYKVDIEDGGVRIVVPSSAEPISNYKQMKDASEIIGRAFDMQNNTIRAMLKNVYFIIDRKGEGENLGFTDPSESKIWIYVNKGEGKRLAVGVSHEILHEYYSYASDEERAKIADGISRIYSHNIVKFGKCAELALRDIEGKYAGDSEKIIGEFSRWLRARFGISKDEASLMVRALWVWECIYPALDEKTNGTGKINNALIASEFFARLGGGECVAKCVAELYDKVRSPDAVKNAYGATRDEMVRAVQILNARIAPRL